MKLIREYNDFDWIEDVSGYHENITDMGGLRYIVVGTDNLDWNIIKGWQHTYPVTEVTTYMGLLCYVVKLQENLYVYVPVEDVFDRERKNINESINDFDWVREIPLDIPFSELEIGKHYKIETTEIFREALQACGKSERLLYVYMGIPAKKARGPYNDVFCDHERDDEVDSIYLEFYDDNHRDLGNFWVTEDMVKFYFLKSDIKESEEDSLNWIKDIPTGIELQPNTLYYFKPHLTLDEIKIFANGITNSEYIKNFLLRTVLERVYQKGPNGGLKYFITSEDVNDRINGWCTGTSVEQAISFYNMFNQVDARKEFGL